MAQKRKSMAKRRVGTYKSNSKRVYAKRNYKRRMTPSRVVSRVNQMYSMIETKESTQQTGVNIGLPHNNIYILNIGGADMNPLRTFLGTADSMTGVGDRIGDKITVKGCKFVCFLENALARTKVHYRIMLVKCPRGVAPNRTNLFKGCASNKMIDMVNTEKFTIVWQTRFNVSVANGAPNVVTATGEPIQTVTSGGQGTKVVSHWIPGSKFGRGGNVQYENAGVDPKFYDYRFVMLAYDWYGTPQDVNNVGKINECYCKLYYKDA